MNVHILYPLILYPLQIGNISIVPVITPPLTKLSEIISVTLIKLS